ncbi:MAG: ribbon-helix-helix protein, CopG family [Thermodesulfobacteriota bacterium]
MAIYTFYLTNMDMIRNLEAIADSEERSVSYIIRKAVEEYLKARG